MKDNSNKREREGKRERKEGGREGGKRKEGRLKQKG
jgi:hypothetical protein